MTTVDLSTAVVSENHRSFKSRKTAEKWALGWANMNTNIEDVEIALGVPFLSYVWNGSENLYVWLVYAVSATDEGWTISSYRFNSNPTQEA
jgi:hypothetical protein